MQTHNKGEMPGKALEKRKLSENHYNKRSPHFSSKIYILFFVLSIVILAGMGWYAWSSFKQLDKFENQRDEMAELRGVILHFDEVLTMSARMAASTGDLMWEERYLKYESQLDETIQQLKIISQDTIKYKFAEKTDIANVELVALEKQAFELVYQGNRQAAANVLYSQKYEELKLSYAEGMTSLTTALKSSAKETHKQLHSRIIIVVVLTATVVLLLSFGWISLIKINKNIIRNEELELFLSEPGKKKFFHRAAIICSAGAVFVAGLGLLGWVPSLRFLGNISHHFIPMAPTASICFILLGLVLLIQIRYRLRGASRFSAVAVTLLLSVFGIIEFAEYFTGIDVENFFIPDAGMLGLMRKARMSPATGATFFLGGVATLLLLLGKPKKKRVKRICSCAGIVGSLIVITGVTILMSYLYGNPLLYGGETIPMAATTAIGFVFLGVGLVAAAGPDHMPIRLLVGHSSRAKLLRVFLPLSVLIVLSQDVLHRFVFVSYHINSALFSVMSLMFFVVITGIIVTVMAGVIGRALDIAEEKIKALAKFPSEDPNPVLRITKDGEVLYCNEAGKLLLGKWKSEVGKTVPEKWRNLITEAFKFEKSKIEEEEEVKDKIFSLIIAPVKEAGYVNLYGRDITDRKQVLYKMNERIKEIDCLYGVANLIRQRDTLDEMFLDVAGLIPSGWQYPESTCSRIIFDGAEYISKPFEETEWKQISDILVEDKKRGSLEVYYMEQHPTLDEGPFLNEERNLINNIAHTLSEAITHKMAEKEIKQAKEQYETLVGNMPEAIYSALADEKGSSIFMSERWGQWTGYNTNDPEIWQKSVHPDDRERTIKVYLEAVKEKKDYIIDYRVVHKDTGEVRWVWDHGSPIVDEKGNIVRFDGIVTDVTERKKAEEEKEQLEAQLHQSQKMEAIGTLAGGIAHDFNNILGALIGYADLVQDDVPEGTRAHENLQEVLIAADRAKELVKQILTFSRKNEVKLIPTQIGPIVEEVLRMLRSSLPTTIEIRQNIESATSLIMADSTQIHQVLLNLCTNGAHAMDEDGGVVEVSLANVDIDSDIRTEYGNLHQGSYVKLTVRDNGCGISEQELKRIFEPFYTTKEAGQGTGMGLSMVHGIVESYGGVITVDSKPGEGTTFNIYFPIAEGKEVMEIESSEVLAGDGELILLVDDDKPMIDTTTHILERLGYSVVAKTDSIEALEVFREAPGKYDLVLTDQTMPKMTGTKLATELKSIRADIPIILCSGFSDNINSNEVKAIGIKEFVMKPISREEISRIIRNILDKKEIAV